MEHTAAMQLCNTATLQRSCPITHESRRRRPYNRLDTARHWWHPGGGGKVRRGLRTGPHMWVAYVYIDKALRGQETTGVGQGYVCQMACSNKIRRANQVLLFLLLLGTGHQTKPGLQLQWVQGVPVKRAPKIKTKPCKTKLYLIMWIFNICSVWILVQIFLL